jgi:hypothetical protein
MPLPGQYPEYGISLLMYSYKENGNTQFGPSIPEDPRSQEVYITAFTAYSNWCMVRIQHDPHVEGPILARRFLGWATHPNLPETLFRKHDFVDERFFADVDPMLADMYSLALLGRHYQPPTRHRDDTVLDAQKKQPPCVEKTVKGKKHLSQIKQHSHAKPCAAIKDLATHLRSGTAKGHPVKALHNGTCGVCNLFRDCGNKKGRLAASIYRAIVLAHLGHSNHLSRLCQRIKERRKHPDNPEPSLPSSAIDCTPKRKIDDQHSPQVAKLPRTVEARSKRRKGPFQFIDGVYTFVENEENLNILRRQDLSGTF